MIPAPKEMLTATVTATPAHIRPIRLALATLLLGALVLAAHLAGWTRYFQAEQLRGLILSAGVWGMVIAL